MTLVEKFKPAVSKRVLFLLAAIVWAIAADRVLSIGIGDILKNAHNKYIFFAIGILGAYIFFTKIFIKIYKRNVYRIVNSQLEKHCAFSFFDLKGFITMAFMITFGISLRNVSFIPKLYLGTFYIVIGLSLLASAIIFLGAFINFKSIKSKYINDKF
ncbi:Uncharacterised protein [[Clostridium] sordellii]|uniref:Membrane protein n=1 Tax=Paraclostridium sordellii TaxID=1505 RepID=A0ABM9RSR9_PARSO|nr:hypothetical protein [Paeniclostridium sordellii]CEJ75127.1 putative membrane protein [[Clostridium] sordellii] [Paeniclostridium sordellii]CEN70896.1 Uncharacterised protein [[Clostridium] sordellii] [Paeniclostridium sordellii]CEN74187.1 Uncharacterised protein [[Clostridium] sordellii] [Paeniclostridium sordellii]CEO30228.1 Uncharacterised protein [[Clostridium] sordellii] [Paeniclostridium sordellii]CEP65767.1 Uncharacterised protein [[Clostridium] sordellii] [Paeniclostridium sordellii